MRSISIGVPSGKPKMWLWEGTEDAEKFEIKGINRKPYVKAYGVRYDLTDKEIEVLHKMQGLVK